MNAPTNTYSHLGKSIVVRFAGIGLLPFKFAEWLIRIFGWKGE